MSGRGLLRGHRRLESALVVVPGSLVACAALEHADVLASVDTQHGPDQILRLAASTGFGRLVFDLLDSLPDCAHELAPPARRELKLQSEHLFLGRGAESTKDMERFWLSPLAGTP